MKKETWIIRFLYGTVPGRLLLKILVHPAVSKGVGKFLDSRLSAWMVPLFVKKSRIDMRQYEKRKYRLGNLLKDETLAGQFSGGLCMIFRLTPQDYHRYCYICDGSLEGTKTIPGRLHCVRPAACASVPVFVENSREYARLHSPRLGTAVQMEVGALLVGKIKNHPHQGYVLQGMEKGCFAFGGSTIIVLVQKGRVCMDPDILQNSKRGIETRVERREQICMIQKRNTF